MQCQNSNSKFNFKILIQNSKFKIQIQIQIQNSNSKFKFKIQIQNSKFKFEIQIQNSNSKFKFKMQIQNANSKFKFKIQIQNSISTNLKTEFKIPKIHQYKTNIRKVNNKFACKKYTKKNKLADHYRKFLVFKDPEYMRDIR